MTVSDRDRYLFDLNGYVVVPGVLDRGTVERLTEILEARCAELDRERPGQRQHIIHQPLVLAAELRALIDCEPILPYLGEWLGADFHLDHEYGMVIRPMGGRVGAAHLHGGGTPHDAKRSYRCQDGRIRCGETCVSYALTDVAAGDGGMGVVPGSHKASFRSPWAADPGPYPEDVVRPVPISAGSAIIFTEALSHCTLPWRGRGDRRCLFYKFTPGGIDLGTAHAYDRTSLPGLTARQRRMLEPRRSEAGDQHAP